jgi:hypothetical protein
MTYLERLSPWCIVNYFPICSDRLLLVVVAAMMPKNICESCADCCPVQGLRSASLVPKAIVFDPALERQDSSDEGESS